MTETGALLRHFLAAIAYRTQKAVRDCKPQFATFRPAPGVRTPHELVAHMNSVIGYARTFFIGGTYRPEILPAFSVEVERFHETLAELGDLIAAEQRWQGISPTQLLQGPLSDAMTHAGQLALLRRLSGDPIPPENFVYAQVSSDNLGPNQPPPAQPDAEWPEAPNPPA